MNLQHKCPYCNKKLVTRLDIKHVNSKLKLIRCNACGDRYLFRIIMGYKTYKLIEINNNNGANYEERN